MSHDQLAIVAVNADAAAKRDAHRGGNSYEASMLRNLLALIHRDGGHYLERHGMDKALEDAEAKIAAWLQRDDMTPNGEVRGASRPAGEASASTVVLAGTTGRKD